MKNGKKSTPTTGSLRSEGALQREREHSQRKRKLIPLLIFGLVAAFIARQEIPAFSSWVDRLLDAEAWTAAEACRKAALAKTANPGFARLTDNGKAEETGGGYYVGDVEYTALGAGGEEFIYRFSCNVTRGGEVVSINAADDLQKPGAVPAMETNSEPSN